MKLLAPFLVAVLACVSSAPAARADGWIFARSYYSHQPMHHVEIARRPPGGPFYTRPQGAYIKSGYRNVRSSIVVGGYSYDHAQFYESWVQFGSQF